MNSDCKVCVFFYNFLAWRYNYFFLWIAIARFLSSYRLLLQLSSLDLNKIIFGIIKNNDSFTHVCVLIKHCTLYTPLKYWTLVINDIFTAILANDLDHLRTSLLLALTCKLRCSETILSLDLIMKHVCYQHHVPQSFRHFLTKTILGASLNVLLTCKQVSPDLFQSTIH